MPEPDTPSIKDTVEKLLNQWAEEDRDPNNIRWSADSPLHYRSLNIDCFQPASRLNFPASPTALLLELHSIMESFGFIVPKFIAEKRTTQHNLQICENVAIEDTPLLFSYLEAPREENKENQSFMDYQVVIPPKGNEAFFNPKAKSSICFKFCFPSHQMQKNGSNITLEVYTNNPSRVHFTCLAVARTFKAAFEQDYSPDKAKYLPEILAKDDETELQKKQKMLVEVKPFFESFYKEVEIFHTRKRAKTIATNGYTPNISYVDMATYVSREFEIAIPNLDTEITQEFCNMLSEALQKTRIGNIQFSYDAAQKSISCNVTNARLSDLQPKGDLRRALYELYLQPALQRQLKNAEPEAGKGM